MSEEKKGGNISKNMKKYGKMCKNVCEKNKKIGWVKHYRLGRNSRTFLQDPGELPEAQCEVDFTQKS